MTSPLPPTELKRLQQRERANRRRARDMGKPFAPVNVNALWHLQEGKCMKTGKPLIFDPRDPDRENGKPIIAHKDCLSMRLSPGHVVGNVWLWRHDANQEEARIETVMLGVGRRVMGETCKPKRKIKSPGFRGHRKFNGERVWKTW